MKLCSVLRLLWEKSVKHYQLLAKIFQLIHPMPELCRAAQALGVPGDVFARHAQTGVFAVEAIQLMHMIPQHTMDFADLRWGEMFAGVEKMLDRRSEEHTSELQSRQYLVCRFLH